MDVLLFEACGVWQTLCCCSVTLLGFALSKHQHLQKQTKMLSNQALFKTPQGGRVAGGLRLFIKLSTIFPSEKVNNCYASLGSGKECIKRSRLKKME